MLTRIFVTIAVLLSPPLWLMGWIGKHEGTWMASVADAFVLRPDSMPWTYLLYGIAHAGILHLVMNLIAFWMLGTPIEKLIGKRQMLALMMVACVVSGLFSVSKHWLLGMHHPGTVGASGIIYGMMFWTLGMKWWGSDDMRQMIAWKPLLINMAVCVGLSIFMSGVDHFAHVGGAIGGLAVAAWMGYRLRRRATAPLHPSWAPVKSALDSSAMATTLAPTHSMTQRPSRSPVSQPSSPRTRRWEDIV
jgi:membrane associated rhomboid family serine protease